MFVITRVFTAQATVKPDEKGKGLFWTGAKTFSHLINRGERKLFYQQKWGEGDRPSSIFFLFFWRGCGVRELFWG